MNTNHHNRPATPRVSDRGAPNRSGFTLVEMLVVIAIIGILAAVLVPVVGGAIRTTKEFAIKADMKNIETAIENYKAKVQAYPVDFGNPFAIFPHVTKHSGRLSGRTTPFINRGIIDTTDTSGQLGNLDNSNNGYWYDAILVNPHFATGLSTVTTRTPSSIDAAESWMFWLHETTTNPAYPLGAVFDGTLATPAWVLDPNWITVWDPDRFMEFDKSRLSDRDNDGWFEYLPPNADENIRAPYVYFDSRTFNYTNTTFATAADQNSATEFVRQRSIYPAWNPRPDAAAGGAQRAFVFGSTQVGNAPTNHPTDGHVGFAQPYGETVTSGYNQNSYQLIASGLDDHFSLHYEGTALGSIDPDEEFIPYDWTPGAADPRSKIINKTVEINIHREDRDNIVNFFNDRIDSVTED